MPLLSPSIRADSLALALASLPGGTVSSIPVGIIRENAILIEQNDAEIRRITEGDRS
jgi:hypothetical protein